MKKLPYIILALFFFAAPVFAESQQTSGVTAQIIIDRARYYLNETTASFWGNSTDMLAYLNAAIMDVARKTECLETTENIHLITGQTEYSLSSNYFNVEKAIYSGATTAYTDLTEKGLPLINLKDLGMQEDVGEPLGYCVWNDKFLVDPQPSSSVSGYVITVYEIERPSEIIIISGADPSGNSEIPTPAKYDDALSMYVAHKAAIKLRNIGLSNLLKGMYDAFVTEEMQRSGLIRKKFEELPR